MARRRRIGNLSLPLFRRRKGTIDRACVIERIGYSDYGRMLMLTPSHTPDRRNDLDAPARSEVSASNSKDKS